MLSILRTFCLCACTKRARPVLWVTAIAALALVYGCPRSPEDEPIRVVVSDESQSGGSSIDEITELARREGELSWYTSLPRTAAEKFLQLFQDEHPYITTHLVRASTFDTVQKVQREIQTANVKADVLHVLDVAIFTHLRETGQLLSYESPQQRYIPSKYKDPGYWWALRTVVLCMAYDSDRLSQSEVPKEWTDLLDERWEGRIALKDAQTAGSAYAQYYFLRELYGISYWRDMAHQNPRIFKTASKSIQAVANDDVAIFSGAMAYAIPKEDDNDSSIRAAWPRDGVPMILGPVAILDGAPHRNAAKLFIDFALSKQGQKALRNLAGVYSVRPDVPPPPGRPPLRDLKVMTPLGGWDEYAQDQEMLRAEYTELFHPESE